MGNRHLLINHCEENIAFFKINLYGNFVNRLNSFITRFHRENLFYTKILFHKDFCMRI